MTRALAVFLVGLAMACQPAAPAAEADPTAAHAGIADTITRRMQDLLAAIRARDSAQVLSCFATDSTMRLIEGGIMTRPDLEAMVGPFYRSMATVESTLEGPLQVAILGPTAAVASGRYSDVFVDTAGQRLETRGTGTWVWVRRGDQWQIIHQHATPDPAAVRS